jgi:TPR repeat protein
MLISLTKRGWHAHIALLKQKASAGEASAIVELGLNLLEGIQDRKGRSIVRRNPRAAVAYLLQAADGGDRSAACSLGYAYDVGLGVRPNSREAKRWYRRAARGGYATAATNLATVYRDAGKARVAFQWWKQAADMGDGDAAVDVGYCYQYGIGTRKSAADARRMYRRAINSESITEYGREAAMYHLAIQFVDHGKKSLAIPLLESAAADNDFSEATTVLSQIKTDADYVPCRCRRFIKKTARGHTRCALHNLKNRSEK